MAGEVYVASPDGTALESWSGIASARCRLAAAPPRPHASAAAAGEAAIDPMASMTADLIQAREAHQPETGR